MLSVYISGKPGIGKNDAARNAAKTIKPLLGGEMTYNEVNLSRKAPVDVSGWPHLTSDSHGRARMDYAIPAEFPMEPGAVIHLEEINLARIETMKAAYSLLLEHQIGRYDVPDDTLIVASGNSSEDSSLVNDMPAPLVSRLLLVELKLDPDEWLEWAYNKGLHPLIVSTLSFQRGLIHDLPGDGHWVQGKQFATPRSWEALSRHLLENPDTKGRVREAAVCGLVGEAAGKQFLNILELEHTLPGFLKVIENPGHAPVPDDSSARICSLWILSNALKDAEDLKWESNFKKCFEYVTRFGSGEMLRLFMSLLSKSTKGVAHNSGVFMTKFATYQNYFRRA